MSKMVLNELQRATRIEQVCRDRMAKAMRRVPVRQTGRVPITGEESLDLPFLKRSIAPHEQWIVYVPWTQGEVAVERLTDRREERPFCPVAVLEAMNHDSGPLEVRVPATKKRDLTYA